MKRHLHNRLAWIPALLFAACVALWPLSYMTPSGAGRRVWNVGAAPPVVATEVGVASARGRVALGTVTRQYPGTPAPGPPRRVVDWFWGGSWVADDVRPWSGPLGFDFGFSRSGPGSARDGWTLYVPWWFPCALTGAITAYLIFRNVHRRREARRRLNLCPRCGYDLRATPQRCPECGATPALVV